MRVTVCLLNADDATGFVALLLTGLSGLGNLVADVVGVVVSKVPEATVLGLYEPDAIVVGLFLLETTVLGLFGSEEAGVVVGSRLAEVKKAPPMVVDLELSGLGEVKIAPQTVVGLCVSRLGEYPSGHWYMANAIQIKPTIHPMATIVEPIANKSFSSLLRL
ncbi:Uncharacterized protein APZ42_008268 [Daphnia magna]|uniref:Uncharacterized protein n=1 Tax=Daphnia magna TaxID=35525 RepID=A0A162D0S6_9CRUS|nr:Uncharacterized protein APZ42_008268 [Daphnia magna]